MALVLDHIYIVFPSRPVADAAALERAGLVVCGERSHAGQGTANICFCFANAYLELLYITDETAVRSPIVRPTRLWERGRWRESGVSPLGVCLRWADGRGREWPVRTWAYRAPFLSEGGAIPIAEDGEGSGGPMLFFSVWPPRAGEGRDPRSLSRVRIECPDVPRWRDKMAAAAPFLTVERGERHAMTVELAGGGARGGEVRLAEGVMTLRL